VKRTFPLRGTWALHKVKGSDLCGNALFLGVLLLGPFSFEWKIRESPKCGLVREDVRIRGILFPRRQVSCSRSCRPCKNDGNMSKCIEAEHFTHYVIVSDLEGPRITSFQRGTGSPPSRAFAPAFFHCGGGDNASFGVCHGNSLL